MPEGTRPVRLLYIDDDHGLARLVQRHMRRSGWLVDVAHDGATGLRMAGEGGFDAIALDHYMPGRDGLEVLADLHAQPGRPPIIFVTAAEEARIAVAALKAGAADYVVKDVHGAFLDLLQAAVRQAVDQAAMRRARARAEQEAAEARAHLERLNARQAVLLREVNHRVANSLQLISSLITLQANRTQAVDARDVLLKTATRVEAVMLIHRRLYTSDDVGTVAMDQYLSGMVEELGRALAGDEALLRLVVTAEPVSVLTDTAVAIGLIVNELVTNATKYAYPAGLGGEIRIALRPADGGALMLTVEDDGGGIAEDQPGGTGFGTLIVSSMARSIRAAVAQDRGHAGTRWVIDIPPPEI
jgi:two-component sensor histidine kinase/CheY-like chemotaxis protein